MAEKQPEKDPIAQAMVRKRWDKTTPKERSEYARKLNAARWGEKKKPVKKNRDTGGKAK